MIAKTLEKELNLEQWQVNKVIRLIDEGNTIPFIARYRKDVTGSLNDELLRKFDERLKYLRNLEDKKTKIIERIDNLGKLDDNLKNQILNAETLVELDDLYRPYKSKKKDSDLWFNGLKLQWISCLFSLMMKYHLDKGIGSW